MAEGPRHAARFSRPEGTPEEDDATRVIASGPRYATHAAPGTTQPQVPGENPYAPDGESPYASAGAAYSGSPAQPAGDDVADDHTQVMPHVAAPAAPTGQPGSTQGYATVPSPRRGSACDVDPERDKELGGLS